MYALPPDLFRAAVRNGFRSEGKIGPAIPLGKQFHTASYVAEGRYSLSHITRVPIPWSAEQMDDL